MERIATLGGRPPAFFRNMALGLAVFIILGFLQFAARGFVDYSAVPIWFHLHGAAMTAWLVLTIVQAHLANRGSAVWHRRLGWTGVALLPVIACFAVMTLVAALHAHLWPPFFTPVFFVSLVSTEVLIFVGLVVAAILRRRETDWHARLILGAMVIGMEPALGRLLPMPLLGPWGGWLSLVVQLGAIVFIIRFDRREQGTVHAATWVVAVTVVAAHILSLLVSQIPAVGDIAARLMA